MEKIKPRSQTASAVVLAFSARGHVNKVEPMHLNYYIQLSWRTTRLITCVSVICLHRKSQCNSENCLEHWKCPGAVMMNYNLVIQVLFAVAKYIFSRLLYNVCMHFNIWGLNFGLNLYSFPETTTVFHQAPMNQRFNNCKQGYYFQFLNDIFDNKWMIPATD